MNITVHTPTDDNRVVERRRCTHVSVERLTIELADGTRFEIREEDGALEIATPPGPPVYVSAAPGGNRD